MRSIASFGWVRTWNHWSTFGSSMDRTTRKTMNNLILRFFRPNQLLLTLINVQLWVQIYAVKASFLYNIGSSLFSIPTRNFKHPAIYRPPSEALGSKIYHQVLSDDGAIKSGHWAITAKLFMDELLEIKWMPWFFIIEIY